MVQSERVSKSTAAISPGPSAKLNTNPVMVAGIIATQSRTATGKHAAPLQPMENHWQAERLGLGVSCTLHKQHNANVAVGGALPTAFASTIR